MKYYILIPLLIIFASFRSDDSKGYEYNSIPKLMDQRLINCEIKSLGGHSGNCTELTIESLSNDTLHLFIEPGRILDTEDSLMQDIFIVKEQKVDVLPLAKVVVNGFGFCCQSSKRSPSKDAKFAIGRMAPEDWIKLAEFLNKNDFPSDAVQYAIWVFSDNHQLSSVTTATGKDITPLINTISKIKKLPVPWYKLVYQQDSSRVFTDRPVRLTGEIKYFVNKNTIISIVVKSKAGEIIASPVMGSAIGSGEYHYYLDIDVTEWVRGEYRLEVLEEYSRVNTSKSFKL